MGTSILNILIMIGLLSGNSPQKNKTSTYPDSYNIVWNSQSENSSGSMPVGGGNLQLNAWCEKNDIMFYMGSTDCYLDNSVTLGKLGRVRLHFSPNPFQQTFKQELNLKESEIIFTGDNGFRLTLHTDVFHPVINVAMQSDSPVQVKASYETWRLNGEFTPDNSIFFYHRNPSENKKLEKDIKDQKLEKMRNLINDPITNLTSGGIFQANELINAGTDSGVYMKTPYKALHLKSEKPIKSLNLQVDIRIRQDNSLSLWKKQLTISSREARNNKKAYRKKSIAWWNDFWNRSYIRINPQTDPASAAQATPGTEAVSTAWQVGRNYHLFRYMLGCTSGGTHPALFNGGIFNFDSSYGAPEYRMWQECEFMAQNQRLVYWPLLKTGDFDIMQPGLNMYTRLLPLQKAKAKEFWNIDGAAYPEALTIYGLQGVYGDPEMMNDCFGRCPDRKRTEYGHSGLIHLEYHYTSMLDFAYMATEYARFGGCNIKEVLPFIESSVKFFDNYYQNKNEQRTGKRLEKDKLVLYPSSALELYAGAKNPTDVIAGLRSITRNVLSLPDLAADKRTYFESLQKRLPEIPLTVKNGYTVFPPAESWELEGSQSNMEFPQLYALFPFETYTFGDPGLETAKNTWLYNSKDSIQKNYICWFQGGIYTAHLGLTEEARQYAVKKFLHPYASAQSSKIIPCRFPTFWSNPGFCHAPDIDHGGAAMVGLQDMLMQTSGNKILLLPAWPSDWDCDFKLHAPLNTTVEGSIRNGKIEKLKVTPQSREKDIVIH